jgi:TDG/mug DNA glycosylase family protein
LIAGLPCIESADSRLLVLGTMPSAESLRRRQYYGNPRNLFWRLLFTAFETADPDDYSRRLEFLRTHRIALWDVLRACDRSGSLDSAIVAGSELPNDIRAFLTTHAGVESIALNGGKAAQLFHRLVAPSLDATGRRIRVFELPSTSPANTATFDSKLAHWMPAFRSVSTVSAIARRRTSVRPRISTSRP